MTIRIANMEFNRTSTDRNNINTNSGGTGFQQILQASMTGAVSGQLDANRAPAIAPCLVKVAASGAAPSGVDIAQKFDRPKQDDDVNEEQRQKRIKLLEDAWGTRCNLTEEQRAETNIYGTNRRPKVIPEGYGFDRKTGEWYKLGERNVKVKTEHSYRFDYQHLPVDDETSAMLDAWTAGEPNLNGKPFPWDAMGYSPDSETPIQFRGVSECQMREFRTSDNGDSYWEYYTDPSAQA